MFWANSQKMYLQTDLQDLAAHQFFLYTANADMLGSK